VNKGLKLELKLGIFVFIGIILLAGLVFSLRDFRSWQAGYNIFIKFNFLNGVKVGAPVRFRGVDVGEVRKIEIINDTESNQSYVKVSCWIKNSVKIPQDSSVWVNTLGILGEKYIEIMPGKDLNFLTKDALIAGNDPVAMHEVQELALKIISDIDKKIQELKTQSGTLGKLLYEDEIYKKINSILDDLKELTSDLRLNPWKLFFRPKKK
jgi:phospholipid/cholesterol/gamma-HCH transport system substrate-binding protein